VTAVTKAMAAAVRGSVGRIRQRSGLAWLSDHVEQLKCLFDTDATSILAVACALPNVDCDQGIATWGHSQGAYVANRGYGFDPRVRAAWLAGYGGDAQSTMPTNRLRVENGENDTTNGQEATVDQVTGSRQPIARTMARAAAFAPTERVGHRSRQGLRHLDADHCWFDKKSCLDSQVTLEQNWIDPNSTKPFALERNATGSRRPRDGRDGQQDGYALAVTECRASRPSANDGPARAPIPIAAIGAVACSMLMHEILLTRVCALRLYFHFAFLVISNCLLGLA